VRIPAPCGEPPPYPSLRLGKRDDECEERNDAGEERWAGGSRRQLNPMLQKRSCKSSNPSVHLMGETEDHFMVISPLVFKKKKPHQNQKHWVSALMWITGKI